MPPIKELHYFNELYIERAQQWASKERTKKASGVLQRYIKSTPSVEWDYHFIARAAHIAAGDLSDDWYGRIFSFAAPREICGEVSSDYYLLPEAGVNHVVRLSPDVKIAFLMRDPIERSWSHMRLTIRQRGIDDFETLEMFALHPELVARADYPAALRRWGAHVPPERLFTAFTDTIAANPKQVLERFCGFLDVAFDAAYFPEAETPVHVGQVLDMPPALYAILKERLRPVYEEISVVFPDIGPVWMARHYGTMADLRP